MLHLAANFVFDGNCLIKNSLITIEDSGNILYVGNEGEALIERPKMIFYNGIICPRFSINDNTLEGQRIILEEIKALALSSPDIPLARLLGKYTKEMAFNLNIENRGIFQSGINPGIILIENVDLLKIKLKVDTFVKIII